MGEASIGQDPPSFNRGPINRGPINRMVTGDDIAERRDGGREGERERGRVERESKR